MGKILDEIKNLDEGNLREKIIIPLLHGLGCNYVKSNHGCEEWGKDVLYKRKHFLDKEIYGAVVAKANTKINKKTLGEVHVQIIQAIDKFVNPNEPSGKVQLYEILLITSGEITEHAYTFIYNNSGKNFPNIHFVDGEKLEQLIRKVITKYNRDNSKFDKKLKFDEFTCDKFKDIFIPKEDIFIPKEGEVIQ